MQHLTLFCIHLCILQVPNKILITEDSSVVKLALFSYCKQLQEGMQR